MRKLTTALFSIAISIIAAASLATILIWRKYPFGMHGSLQKESTLPVDTAPDTANAFAQSLNVLHKAIIWFDTNAAVIFTGLGIVSVLVITLLARRNYLNRLMRSPHLVTPADLSSWTRAVASRIEKQDASLRLLAANVDSTRTMLISTVQQSSQTFLKLQSALDQRDAQIKRAEEGWDLHVFKKYVRQFAKVDEYIGINSPLSAEQKLQQVAALLRDALEECGIEIFEPAIGVDFRTEKGVSDKPALFPTSDKELHFKIKAVQLPGYRFVTDSGVVHIVRPARVEIYSPKEDSGE